MRKDDYEDAGEDGVPVEDSERSGRRERFEEGQREPALLVQWHSAQEISERGLDLYKRLVTFSGHMEKIGKGLKNALEGYNFAVGSLERNVLPAARKFKDLQRQTHGAELPAFEPQDDNIRHLTLAAEDEPEKKRA